MSAATADFDSKRSEGKLKSYQVAATTTIYKGTLVGTNSAGYLVPMSDTSGLGFVGVAAEKADNGTGGNGDLSCRVYRDGEFEFVYAGGDAAQTLVDGTTIVYAQDDQTVDEDASLTTNDYPVGPIVEVVSATRVRVLISGHLRVAGAVVAGDIASNAVTTAKIAAQNVTSAKLAARTVTAKTADYTVLTTDAHAAFTTVGASGTVVFDLPAATVGLEYFFRVGAAQELRINPNGSEVIALPSTGVAGAAGKYLTANADGETVHLMCTKAGEWSVFGYTGTWTAEG